jgi:transposase InsO family protein
MVVTSTANKPFEKIFLDIVGPLETSTEGNTYILTMQDDLTKFSSAVPLVDHTANSIAKAFVENFVCLHGIPESIVTDQGQDVLSKIFTACCKLLQIDKIKTTAYHPQSNGAFERSHRTLAEYLRHFVNNKQQNWDQYLAYSMFVYNSSVHSTTGFQPYELVYGRQLEVPHSLSRTPQLNYNYEDYNFEIKKP